MFLCSKYTLRNVNENEWQQFGSYNSSQAASHKISDIICTSFLILDFVEVFRSTNSRCTLGFKKTFKKGPQFLCLTLKNAGSDTRVNHEITSCVKLQMKWLVSGIYPGGRNMWIFFVLVMCHITLQTLVLVMVKSLVSVPSSYA